MKRPLGFILGLNLGIAFAAPANAHPHIFVDGGIDFIMSGQEEWNGSRLAKETLLRVLEIPEGSPVI